MNKRGMLGNIIGGILVLLVGFALVPMIAQQIDLATNCNQTNITNVTIQQADTGATNSFGGAGSEHFGGYTGTVAHASFSVTHAIGTASIIPAGNQSMFGCWNLYSSDNTSVAAGSVFTTSAAFLSIIPFMFCLGIGFIAVVIIYTAIRNVGLLGTTY